MRFKNLGTSGLRVSVAGIGCNNFGAKCDKAATKVVVHKALDEGITFFDTADIYSRGASETLLGKALNGKRDEVVIATKFCGPMGDGEYMKGASRRYIMQAVEASLKRLDTDYIDLYQIHFPDASTPVEETLWALDDLVHSGQVRYIGCSNFSGWQLVEANRMAKEMGLTSFITAQNHYSLVERNVERELVPAAKAYGVSVLPYFPLACGLLTGKYRKGEDVPEGTRFALREQLGAMFGTDENYDVVDKLDAFARDRNKTVLDVALGWLGSSDTVGSVIAGATSADQVTQNAAAANWELSAEDADEISLMTLRF
jgi:aryl-alcohol dehydrogenase-like predicted oxidoreductase